MREYNQANIFMTIGKKIIQISLTAVILAVGIFSFAGGAFAGGKNEIKVEVWNGSDWELLCQSAGCADSNPLFQNTNFLPGDVAERRVRITNEDVSGDGSGTQKEISIQAINVSDPCLDVICIPFVGNRFGDILNFKIIGNEGVVYEKTLSKFFEETQDIMIAAVPNGGNREFVFQVNFNQIGDDKYQNKSLGFDVIFGLRGEEGGTFSGSGLPPGLSILDESVEITSIGQDSATIAWETSYLSTSQVIYAKAGEAHALDLGDNAGNPSKYGYARTSSEENFNPKVTSHIMVIEGLEEGTTYYYRTVSHASPPSISRSHSFTTLGKDEIASADRNAGSGEDRSPSGEGLARIDRVDEIKKEIKEVAAGEKNIRREKSVRAGNMETRTAGTADHDFDAYKSIAGLISAFILISSIIIGYRSRKRES